MDGGKEDVAEEDGGEAMVFMGWMGLIIIIARCANFPSCLFPFCFFSELLSPAAVPLYLYRLYGMYSVLVLPGRVCLAY